MATVKEEEEGEWTTITFSTLKGKILRPIYKIRPTATLEQIYRSIRMQLRCNADIIYDEKPVKLTATPESLGLPSSVDLPVLLTSNPSHFHYSPDLETICPWCSEKYSEDPERVPIQTACGHWLCFKCYKKNAECNGGKNGIRCLLHGDRFLCFRFEDDKLVDSGMAADLASLFASDVMCTAPNCKKKATMICIDCERFGRGAQCTEHSNGSHGETSVLSDHKPVPIGAPKAQLGGSSMCTVHKGEKLAFAVEEKKSGVSTFKMYCLKCMSKDGVLEISGQDIDSLKERLTGELSSIVESEFRGKYESGVRFCLDLEARFREFIGEGESVGTIEEAKKKIRRFYEGVIAILRENCAALEDQVDVEAEKRIAVLQGMLEHAVASVSTVQYAMAIHRAVDVSEASSAAVVRCHNRMMHAKLADLPPMEKAPPSAFEVDLPLSTVDSIRAECVGKVHPPRPGAPVDVSVAISASGVLTATWQSGTEGDQTFEVQLDASAESPTASPGVSLYSGSDRTISVDLSGRGELEEDRDYAVKIQSIVDSETSTVRGKSAWSHAATFRIPVGALGHPVMVVAGGYIGSALSSVEGFDMVTRKWISLQELPGTSYGGICAVLENTLFLGTWYYIGAYSPAVLKVDGGSSELSWSSSVSCLNPKHCHGSLVCNNGSLWALAGDSCGNVSCGNVVEHWKPGESRWTSGPSLTCTGGGTVSVALESGGIVSTHRTAAEILKESMWTRLPDLPVSMNYSASGELQGRVIVTGGNDNPNKACALDVREKSWKEVASMHAARQKRPASVVWNGEMYVAGGLNGSTYLNTMEIYDPRADAWRKEDAVMTTGRGYATAGLLPMKF